MRMTERDCFRTMRAKSIRLSQHFIRKPVRSLYGKIPELRRLMICREREAESGTENNATQILQVYGLTELVKTEELNYTDAVKELEEGKIDAMFCTAGIRTLVLEELANKCEVNWLSLEDKQIAKLKAVYPDYSEYVIPAGTYARQESEVKTVAVQAVLVVSDTMSTERVKELTKLFFEKKKDLQYATSLELPQDEASAVEGVSIPFHPGAAEYYAEHGVIVNSKG